jgi:MFS family permease
MTDLTGHPSSPSRVARLWLAFAPALRFRNYRLFWLGLTISTAGTYLQQVAEGWLIYDMTGSKLLLGVVGAVALVPVVPISFLGGLIIDRVPRRKLIIVAELGLLIQAAIFGLLIISNQIQIWHIFILDFTLGAFYAIELPARQAFLSELVNEDHLASAIALNATTITLARTLGYIMGGALIATLGVGGAMLLNAATYLAPILALVWIRLQDVAQDVHRQSLGVALAEGVTTLRKQPSLAGTIGLMTIVGGLGSAAYVMMPAFAEDVLRIGPVGLGLLLGAAGLGGVIGTAAVARLGKRRRGYSLTVVSLLLPALTVAFAYSHTLALACLLLVAHGMVLLILHALANTLVQINVPDRVRGRVMSIYALLNVGGPKAGGVLVGGLAEPLGLPLVLGLSGIISVLYAVGLYKVMPSVRQLD